MAAAVEVQGLRDFVRDLRALDRAGGSKVWAREMSGTHRDLGRIVVGLASSRAEGQAHHFLDQLRSRPTQQASRVAWSPRANTAFMGAKKHTGWYAAARFADGPPQHPPWVGTGWVTGGPGGPYAVNPAIRANLPLIVETYGRMIDHVTRRAFPD